MPLQEQLAAYEANTIPESKRVARGGLTSAAKVDSKRAHNPLLIVKGSTDNIIPASINRRNFNAYKKNGSVIEYKEFEGNNHFVVGIPEWKSVADYILNWMNSH
jgi:alpha-beta hydrolase superfamily lysophospholipase